MYYAMELSLLASVAICRTITHGWQHCSSQTSKCNITCGIEIENAFRGISNELLQDGGIFQTLVGDSSIGEILIDSSISGVTFTGSDSVGGKVAERATLQ